MVALIGLQQAHAHDISIAARLPGRKRFQGRAPNGCELAGRAGSNSSTAASQSKSEAKHKTSFTR
jgi:hypothetical protein